MMIMKAKGQLMKPIKPFIVMALMVIKRCSQQRYRPSTAEAAGRPVENLGSTGSRRPGSNLSD